eukprot:jgi/Botrbrau1/8821/Bobra.0335s0011.1
MPWQILFKLPIILGIFLVGFFAQDFMKWTRDFSARCLEPCTKLMCWEVHGVPPEKYPVIYNTASMAETNYDRPGLAHITVAGNVHHGLLDVEIWRQVLAPGSRTPIHEHDCEEVFVVEKGIATCTHTDPGGSPSVQHGTVFANQTLFIPPNERHRIANEDPDQDLQYIVVLSNPPMRIRSYMAWEDANPSGPEGLHIFDKACPFFGPQIR